MKVGDLVVYRGNVVKIEQNLGGGFVVICGIALGAAPTRVSISSLETTAEAQNEQERLAGERWGIVPTGSKG